MSRTVIDLDDELMKLAAEAFGTRSKKDTIHEALTRAIREEMRSRHLERFTSGDNPDLNNPSLMDAAWTGTEQPHA